MLSPVLALAAVLAAGPKTAIVDVEAPDLMIGLAGQVTRALVAEAQAQQFDLITPDQLSAMLDAKQTEALRKCGGKPPCLSHVLEPLGIARVVTGQLGRDDRNYLLKLWFVDLKTLAIIADVDRAILIAARRLQKDVEQAVPPLLRGEREARGTLVLSANLADAQVSLNGDFVGTPPQTLTLRPGKYEVKLERKKYLSITRLLAVEANQETKADFKLLLKPGELPDEQVVPELAKKADAQPTTFTPSGLTWVLGAVTIAAGGTAAAFGLIARSQETTLTTGYDATTDTYASTRALALEQNRNATIANVTAGVAGAGLIATILSAVVDAGRVQVTPVVTASGAAVTIGGRF